MDELCAEKVTVRLPDRAAVRDLSLQIAAGEISAIIGSDGAGKLTLPRAQAGSPTAFRQVARVSSAFGEPEA